MALLQGTLLRGSISPRVPLVLTPRFRVEISRDGGQVPGLSMYGSEFRVQGLGLGVGYDHRFRV